jgi:RHS repeat-associated protein
VVSSAVTATYRYDAFGNVLASSGGMAASNKYRFSTKPVDEECVVGGLAYYGFRYYHFGVGRWGSRDPLEEISSTNLYESQNNEAINVADVLGLENWVEVPNTRKVEERKVRLLGALDRVSRDYYYEEATDCCFFDEWLSKGEQWSMENREVWQEVDKDSFAARDALQKKKDNLKQAAADARQRAFGMTMSAFGVGIFSAIAAVLVPQPAGAWIGKMGAVATGGIFAAAGIAAASAAQIEKQANAIDPETAVKKRQNNTPWRPAPAKWFETAPPVMIRQKVFFQKGPCPPIPLA